MIKKIQQYFAKRKQLNEQKKKLVKAQKYYEILRCGASFVKFVQDDLNSSGVKIDRHQRRRMKKTLIKGEFTPELINHYKNNIERVLENINKKEK